MLEGWQEYLATILIYAAGNPGEFIFYVLLILSPLFAISACLSYKLYKAVEAEEREKKRGRRLHTNLAKTRHRKTD